MAFRRADLQAVGGFDLRYRVAGDDVDICWWLRQKGRTLGFNPAAMVWHHRRDSVRAYWKQQKGYGKSEALLEKKWPEKHNAAGHFLWSGRIYGKGLTRALGWRRERVHHGTWGTGLFQSIYQSAPGVFGSLPLMPEWYLVIVALVALSGLGALWEPLLLALPLLGLAVGLSLLQAGTSAAQASFASAPRSRVVRLKLVGLTAFLHLLQPLARLYGRLRHGLTPWRGRGLPGLRLPRPRAFLIWSEHWRDASGWLQCIEETIRTAGGYVSRGGEYDRWELEVRGGMLGAVRVRMAIEEHGAGRQLLRFYAWPRCNSAGLMLILLFAALAVSATLSSDTTPGYSWIDSAILGMVAATLTLRMLWECAAATATTLHALQALEKLGKVVALPDNSRSKTQRT